MKSRPVDEFLAASSELIAQSWIKLAQLQFSVHTCVSRIEISADAIAASQALLAKFDGKGSGAEESAGSEQTSASASGGDAPRA